MNNKRINIIIYDDLDNSDEEYNERVREITNHFTWRQTQISLQLLILATR